MGKFNSLTKDGLEQSKDQLGGGFQPLESGIYQATIKALYAGQSAQGATSVTLIASIEGREYNETFYVTNRKGQNYYLSKQDSVTKIPLPGFTTVDELCLIATGNDLSEQETEDKVISLYNRDAKADVPTTVPMIMAAVGQKVALGILAQRENKTVKVGDAYLPTEETRVVNLVDKVFHPELHLTVNEAQKGATSVSDAKFWEAWAAKNTGVTRDRVKPAEAAANQGAPQGGSPARPAAAAASKRPSLFGAKA